MYSHRYIHTQHLTNIYENKWQKIKIPIHLALRKNLKIKQKKKKERYCLHTLLMFILLKYIHVPLLCN